MSWGILLAGTFFFFLSQQFREGIRHTHTHTRAQWRDRYRREESVRPFEHGHHYFCPPILAEQAWMEDRLDCGRDDKVDEEGPPEECLPHLKRQLRSGAAEKPPSPWTPNPKSVGLPQVDGPESGLFLVVVLGNSKSTIHRRRQLCILRTWGAGISVVFPDHHMWSMFALMHHVYGKYRGFSWYIFMDDRTWVNVPALTKFLETKSPHVLEYGGTGVNLPPLLLCISSSVTMHSFSPCNGL